MIREQIEDKLRAAFEPVFLEVVDESYRHNVPAGSESHFKVVLVSDRFSGERFLNRHRMIYGTLAAELSSTVHALALHTYTIKELPELFQYVAYSLSKNGLRAVLFCLSFEREAQFLGQNYLGIVKNGATMRRSRSRLTKVMPL